MMGNCDITAWETILQTRSVIMHRKNRVHDPSNDVAKHATRLFDEEVHGSLLMTSII